MNAKLIFSLSLLLVSIAFISCESKFNTIEHNFSYQIDLRIKISILQRLKLNVWPPLSRGTVNLELLNAILCAKTETIPGLKLNIISFFSQILKLIVFFQINQLIVPVLKTVVWPVFVILVILEKVKTENALKPKNVINWL